MGRRLSGTLISGQTGENTAAFILEHAPVLLEGKPYHG